jgi:hypothetical protein
VLQIAADGDLPGNVDERAGLAEEAPCDSLRAGAKTLAQDHRLDAGDRHSLTVDWIEAAKRVAVGQKSFGKPRQLVVVAAKVGAELIGYDRRQRLGVPDRLENLGRRQGAGEFQETGFVSRHLVAQVAAEAGPLAIATRA